jgi:hypothetical protein
MSLRFHLVAYESDLLTGGGLCADADGLLLVTLVSFLGTHRRKNNLD